MILKVTGSRDGVFVCWGGCLSLSGIFPEERELGGSPPWDAFASSCWFLGVSVGTHAEPSERRQEETEGDGPQVDVQGCSHPPWPQAIRSLGDLSQLGLHEVVRTSRLQSSPQTTLCLGHWGGHLQPFCDECAGRGWWSAASLAADGGSSPK